MGAGVVFGRTVCEAIGLDGVMVAVLGGGTRTARGLYISVRRFVGMETGLRVITFDSSTTWCSLCLASTRTLIFCCAHQRRSIRSWPRALLEEIMAEEGNAIRNKL